MNTYESILAAADQIEAHPEVFDFETTGIPHACGSPGCALGWIGFFYGARRCTESDGYSGVGAVARIVLGLPSGGKFYDRMSDLQLGDASWTESADECARCLRLYAEKHHGHEKQQQRPTSVMVTDLMARVMAGRIPEGMLESPEYGQ